MHSGGAMLSVIEMQIWRMLESVLHLRSDHLCRFLPNCSDWLYSCSKLALLAIAHTRALSFALWPSRYSVNKFPSPSVSLYKLYSYLFVANLFHPAPFSRASITLTTNSFCPLSRLGHLFCTYSQRSALIAHAQLHGLI